MLVTTHYIEEVEGCDRVCVIDQGKVLALDTPEALKRAHGQQLLRIVPRTDGRPARHPGAPCATGWRARPGGGDRCCVGRCLRRGASWPSSARRIRSLTVEVPSLETVFLSLTGRDLRDQAAGARERTLAFGKRGGEHTR